jgi:Zn-dependent peptidase ImmA (M78 family)
MLPKRLKILRKFGRRRLTGRDFIELCRLNHIVVILSEDCSRGMYYFANGRHTIVLSTRLTPEERQIVGWHEFAHFLQNSNRRTSIAAFSGIQPSRASEKLADVFAAIALNPDSVRITGPVDFIKMIMRTRV